MQAHWWVFSQSEGRITARQAAATRTEAHSPEDSELSTGERESGVTVEVVSSDSGHHDGVQSVTDDSAAARDGDEAEEG